MDTNYSPRQLLSDRVSIEGSLNIRKKLIGLNTDRKYASIDLTGL